MRSPLSNGAPIVDRSGSGGAGIVWIQAVPGRPASASVTADHEPTFLGLHVLSAYTQSLRAPLLVVTRRSAKKAAPAVMGANGMSCRSPSGAFIERPWNRI